MEISTNSMMIIILQYINISNEHRVHLKITHYFVTDTSKKLEKHL